MPNEPVPVFLVAENQAGEFSILEAKGTQLSETEWSIRRGCFIEVIPAGKVYLTRKAAQDRIKVLEEE